MQEIKIYADSEKTKELTKIDFETVKAGETTERRIFIENQLDYNLDVELELSGEDVKITEESFTMKPKATRELIFLISPKLTKMQPVKAEIKLKLNYIIT